jgi:predicted exporter
MLKSKFDRLFDFIGKNKFILLLVFSLVIIGSFIRINSVNFVNDISIMLPDSPKINRSLNFINTSEMSDTIVFSVTSINPDKNLISLTNGFAKELKKVPQITKVVTGVENLDISKIKTDLAKLLPLLLSKQDYALFKDIEEETYLPEQVRQMFVMLTTPGSSLMQGSMGIDPLGWSNPLLKKLTTLSKSMGFDVELANNHFVDKTHKYALVIAKTSVPVTDADNSESLLLAIDKITRLFPGLKIETICGHKHTVSNQNIIKQDILVTTVMITLAFIGIMLFMFKTFDALSIFILPFFAIVIAVFISSFIFPSLSFFMIGFAAVIAGFSVDYGIHLFAAWKTKGYEGFKDTIKPVIIASLSTMGVFVSFFVSSVYGYKELAIFSILSIVVCVVLSIFFVPHFWRKKGTLKTLNIPSDLSLSKSKLVLVVWGILFVLSMACLVNSNFTKATDITKFDGSEQSIFDSETAFHNIWGGKKRPGVIITPGADIERAWQDYELISAKLAPKMAGFNSLAMLLPSQKQQKENLKTWKEFWTKDKIARVKDKFLKATTPYGFQSDFFDPFFVLLESNHLETQSRVPDGLKMFEPNFINHTDTYRLLSFFNDTKENTQLVASVLKDYPDSYIVSRRELSSLIGEKLILDMKKISLFAGCWILGLIILFLRKPKQIFLALLPVASSIPFVFLVLTVFSMDVTAIILITLIIILGLSLDYGVFISNADSVKKRDSVIIAASFSMITTIMGAGALLFASHPVMFSIGVTLVSGVTAAYLSAVFCIPAFQKVFK